MWLAGSLAGDDLEAGVAGWGEILSSQRLDSRQRRRLRLDGVQEAPDLRAVALDLEQDSVDVVEHPAGQTTLLRKAVHERPEPDPLNGSRDAGSDPAPRPGGRHR
jgi:hypothetical protein